MKKTIRVGHQSNMFNLLNDKLQVMTHGTLARILQLRLESHNRPIRFKIYCNSGCTFDMDVSALDKVGSLRVKQFESAKLCRFSVVVNYRFRNHSATWYMSPLYTVYVSHLSPNDFTFCPVLPYRIQSCAPVIFQNVVERYNRVSTSHLGIVHAISIVTLIIVHLYWIYKDFRGMPYLKSSFSQVRYYSNN